MGGQMEGKRFFIFLQTRYTAHWAQKALWKPPPTTLIAPTCFQGFLRSFCPGLWGNLRFATRGHKLLQQLWPSAIPGKPIPLFIHNIKEEKALPVYGDGLYTGIGSVDHARAIDKVYHEGLNGETTTSEGSMNGRTST